MPIADSDRLGPKGHVYVELVREQYRAPLERGSARRALLTALLGVVLVVFGIIGTFVVYGESVVLVAVGAVAFVSAMPDLAALRPEFEEARRIGWVEPSFDDSIVTVGEPTTFRAVLHARRALSLRGVTMVAEARPWQGARAGDAIHTLVLPVTASTGEISSGDDWRQTVTFRIPPDAPGSHYDSADSVRWTLTMELTFDGQAPWRRSWPMLVYPADQG
jgi:hypothetical protein